MFFAFSFYLYFSLLNQILSQITDRSIIQIENSQMKQITLLDLSTKYIYLVSTNNISGTYTYDIQSPYLLELSKGISDSINTIPDTFDGHYEKIEVIKGYFCSISVNIKEDNKFTFIKISIKDELDEKKENKIIIEMIENYTWNILGFVLILSFFEIFGIIFFCCFRREFVMEFCDFRKKENKKIYKKLEEIYELNVIDIE